MQIFVDQLSLRMPQGTVHLNAKVSALTFDHSDGRWVIRSETRDSISADAVCIALPAYAAAPLLGEMDTQLAAELAAIPYESTATINLAYKRPEIFHPLDGFGFVVPFIEKRSTLACTFSSIKFRNRAPDDDVLLRAFVGGALQPEMFALDEDEIVQRVRADLRDLLGIETAPLFAEVAKWDRSMPQYHVGHLERVKRIDERVAALPGLVLAGNAYLGIGIPDCIRSGETAARKILSSLRGCSSFADPEGNRVG
jgi:oxygen-dependent protoporphyrinogen oxidase